VLIALVICIDIHYVTDFRIPLFHHPDERFLARTGLTV